MKRTKSDLLELKRDIATYEINFLKDIDLRSTLRSLVKLTKGFSKLDSLEHTLNAGKSENYER